MSLFFRPRPEERAVTSVPWSHGGPSLSESSGMESQLSLVPVYASTRIISEAISSLTLQRFRRTSDGRRIQMPLPRFLADPLNETQFTWLQKCAMSLLLPGNAYGLEVGLDGSEPAGSVIPESIEWLNPQLMDWENRWVYNGQPIDERRLLHIPAVTLPGRKLGLSPLGACSSTLKAGSATQDFMRDWYRNRAIPGLVFRNEAKALEAPEATAIRERLKSTLRSGEPFVTGKDWSMDVLKISAEDAGFVSSMRLTATQIANIYGVPPEMVGGEKGSSMTYANTEQEQIQFINMTLRPWLVRLEQAFSALLPAPQYVKFNVDSMIRVDTKTRYEVHQIARNIGLNNIDELRALEDEEPLPDNQGTDYSPLAAKAPVKETP